MLFLSLAVVHLSLYVELTSCSQFLQLTLSIQPSSLVVCTWYSKHSDISCQNLQLCLDYEYLFLLTSYSAFSDKVYLKYWGCLHFRFLCSLNLFPVCFFRFSSILLSSSVIKKRVSLFSIQYFIGIFGTGLIFLKSLEAVISSGKCQKNVSYLE